MSPPFEKSHSNVLSNFVRHLVWNGLINYWVTWVRVLFLFLFSFFFLLLIVSLRGRQRTFIKLDKWGDVMKTLLIPRILPGFFLCGISLYQEHVSRSFNFLGKFCPNFLGGQRKVKLESFRVLLVLTYFVVLKNLGGRKWHFLILQANFVPSLKKLVKIF